MRGVSEEVLDGIARALQLDEGDRMHLFDLVRSSNTAPTGTTPTGTTPTGTTPTEASEL